MRRRYLLGSLAGAIAAAAIAARLLRRERKRSFSGKVVVILGGSRGLGLMLAREFASRGARLAIGARNQAVLDSARGERGWDGADVVAMRCDVRLRSEVERFIAAVERHYGRIDVL